MFIVSVSCRQGLPHIESIHWLFGRLVVLCTLISQIHMGAIDNRQLSAVSAHYGKRDCSKRPATFSFKHAPRTLKGEGLVDGEALADLGVYLYNKTHPVGKRWVGVVQLCTSCFCWWGKPILAWSKVEFFLMELSSCQLHPTWLVTQLSCLPVAEDRHDDEHLGLLLNLAPLARNSSL